MKIAITANNNDMNSEIDPRFGRAKYFAIVDTESNNYCISENSMAYDAPQGAGIQAAQKIINLAVEVLITGNCGPKAFRVLEEAGIDVYNVKEGKIMSIVEKFKKGLLKPAKASNVEGHW